MLAFPKRGVLRLGTAVAFVASAGLAAAGLKFAWQKPLIAAGFVAAGLAIAAWRWLSRRRLERLLRSGDAEGVSRWAGALEREANGATVAPLMRATAFTAYGRIEMARAALDAAERGPAWEDALEHRLFLDALLFAFEGDAESALDRAARLARMPLPSSGKALRERVETLRRAVSALARAFCHQSAPGDRALLERASEVSPLVFWAMRYAAAIVAVDEGDLARAEELLATAPDWPAESAFRGFHDEITRVARSAG